MKKQIHIFDTHLSILGKLKALTSIIEEKRYVLGDRIPN